MLIACFVTVHMCISFFFHRFVTYGHFLVGRRCIVIQMYCTRSICAIYLLLMVDSWRSL